MNRYSQLTHLILSFYREDLPELRQIRLLPSCKLSRRWGVLRIDCQDQQTANVLLEAIVTIRRPVSQLRLAHKISVLVKGSLLTTLPVNSPKVITLSAPWLRFRSTNKNR